MHQFHEYPSRTTVSWLTAIAFMSIAFAVLAHIQYLSVSAKVSASAMPTATLRISPFGAEDFLMPIKDASNIEAAHRFEQIIRTPTATPADRGIPIRLPATGFMPDITVPVTDTLTSLALLTFGVLLLLLRRRSRSR